MEVQKGRGNLTRLLSFFFELYICLYFYFLMKYGWHRILLFWSVLHSDLKFSNIKKGSHDKCSNHLSQYKVITILLTIFLVLDIVSMWLVYFINGGLYHLISFICFLLFSLANTCLFSVSLSLLPFCFILFLHSIYEWDQKVFVCLCLNYFT